MRHAQRGFTYFGALFLVVLMGAALAGAGQLWSEASVRAKERDLIWIGTQYAHALRSYYNASPGTRQYPVQLEELLDDRRFPGGRRHLRRLYPDPITKSTDWGLVQTADNRIAGVFSRSESTPRKTDRFPPEWIDFAGKQSYSEWRFVALRVFQDDLRRRPASGAMPGASTVPGAPTMPGAPTTPASPSAARPDVPGFAQQEPAASQEAGEPGAGEPPAKPPVVTLPRPPRSGSRPFNSFERR